MSGLLPAAPGRGLNAPGAAAARIPQDKTVIQRHIDATDRRIDWLVYELYDLSDEEIAIVEEATGD